MKIERYLPPSFYTELCLERCVIASVLSKMANEVMKQLKAFQTALSKSGHLKRIRKDESKDKVKVLLCLEEEKELYNQMNAVLKEHFLEISVEMIPVNAPQTR